VDVRREVLVFGPEQAGQVADELGFFGVHDAQVPEQMIRVKWASPHLRNGPLVEDDATSTGPFRGCSQVIDCLGAPSPLSLISRNQPWRANEGHGDSVE
jgi:hypothetical protein